MRFRSMRIARSDLDRRLSWMEEVYAIRQGYRRPTLRFWLWRVLEWMVRRRR